MHWAVSTGAWPSILQVSRDSERKDAPLTLGAQTQPPTKHWEEEARLTGNPSCVPSSLEDCTRQICALPGSTHLERSTHRTLRPRDKESTSYPIMLGTPEPPASNNEGLRVLKVQPLPTKWLILENQVRATWGWMSEYTKKTRHRWFLSTRWTSMGIPVVPRSSTPEGRNGVGIYGCYKMWSTETCKSMTHTQEKSKQQKQS